MAAFSSLSLEAFVTVDEKSRFRSKGPGQVLLSLTEDCELPRLSIGKLELVGL